MTSTALVLFMTIPGLALFYAGLVRTKNVLSVLMQCLALTGLITLVWLVIGLATLLLGAELLVDGSIEVARILGVSEVFIGVTLVAIGTSLPELAVSLVSALKGEYGLAIGNIVGSNIFNLLAVIGIAAAIDPSALAPSVLSLHIFVMVAFTLVLFAMTYDYDGKNDLSRLEGIALLTAYFAYFGYVVTQSV